MLETFGAVGTGLHLNCAGSELWPFIGLLIVATHFQLMQKDSENKTNCLKKHSLLMTKKIAE